MKLYSILSVKGLILLAVAAALAAPAAFAADDPIVFVKPMKAAPRDPDSVAKVTIRGYGAGTIDTVDQAGSVVESVDQRTLFLNQSPPHVIARRTAALNAKRDRANQYRIDQAERRKSEAKAAEEAAEAAAQERRIAELEATVRRMEDALRKPVRDRYTGRIVTRM